MPTRIALSVGGVRGRELVTINGHEYKILDHVNNRLNGYQGTVYQRADTNESWSLIAGPSR